MRPASMGADGIVESLNFLTVWHELCLLLYAKFISS